MSHTSSTSEETDVPHPVGLMDLPLELIGKIIPHTYEYSKGCLCLTHPVFRDLMSAKDLDWEYGPVFLMRLAQDNPRVFFCFDCLKLHHLATMRLGCLFHRRLIVLDQGAVNRTREEDVMMEFRHVQMAMRAHRHGQQYGMGLAEIPFGNGNRIYDSEELEEIRLSTAMKIVDGKLLSKISASVVINSKNPGVENIKQTMSPGSWVLGALVRHSTCGHISPRYLQYEIQWGYRNARKTCKNGENFPKIETNVCRCPGCPREVQLTFETSSEKIHKVVCTGWVDLGDGNHPTGPLTDAPIWEDRRKSGKTPPYFLSPVRPTSAIHKRFESDSAQTTMLHNEIPIAWKSNSLAYLEQDSDDAES